MASLDWHLTRTEDVTFVELLVRSERDERVRIESRLDPVWPPRKQGVPAAGWHETGFEGVLSADEPLVLGYASPADPVEPPAEIIGQHPVSGSPEDRQDSFDTPENRDSSLRNLAGCTDDSFERMDEETSARAIVRTLGGVAPPRDAVPLPAPDNTRASPAVPPNQSHPDSSATHPHSNSAATHPHSNSAATHPHSNSAATQSPPHSDSSATQSPPHQPREKQTGKTHRLAEAEARPRPATTDPRTHAQRPQSSVADASQMQSWFATIEKRIEEAERFTEVTSVDEAQAAIAGFGGIEAVRELDAQLTADRRQLETLRKRHSELQSGLAAVDIPLSTLERLV